jgi:two-component system NarL family response regulator
MRILLADDHSLFVEGLQNLLQAGGYEVVGAAYDGFEALHLARTLQPDLILMDIRMPKCNGLEATRLIKAELPEIQIVILTTSADEVDLFDAIKSGASGYLLKNLKPNVLFNYLNGLTRGEAPLSRELSTHLLREFVQQASSIEEHKQALEERAARNEGFSGVLPPEAELSLGLTARQREILEMAAAGLAYKEIGAALHLSENTVKYHMGEIVQRLHVKNREQVVAYALRTGLVDLSKLARGVDDPS